MKKNIAVVLFLLPLLVLTQPSKPKLIIFLSIDQMRADYFDRYGKYFTGGLKKLSSGIVYSNADLNYATSETGPGHATLGTGCYPRTSGILANEWVDPETKKDVYCVADSTAGKVDGVGGGFSPRNLIVTGIGDWLKKNSPTSKVISASSKDRAAILMGGKNPDGVFWYSKSIGGMVSSNYYFTTLPQWVKNFNSSNWIETHVPDAWTKSLPESEYLKIGPDEFFAEQKWGDNTSFPHIFTSGKKAEEINGTPYGDQFVLTFALEGVKEEKLGQRGVTDLLCVSLSNCDYVGHGYGPDSHEILDLLVKLDINLENFFSEIEKQVGKDGYVVALSADHAVCPLPEFNAAFRNIPAKRYDYNSDIKPKFDSLSNVLKKKLNTTEDVIIKNSFLNYQIGKRDGLDSIQLEQKVKADLLTLDAFVDVYLRRELTTNSPSTKPFIQKYRNSYFAPRGEDFQYLIREFCIISSKTVGTTHGTPYEYDTHIPMLFWWNNIKSEKIKREVHSIDIAPSLARFVGFPFPDFVDGKPLKEIHR